MLSPVFYFWRKLQRTLQRGLSAITEHLVKCFKTFHVLEPYKMFDVFVCFICCICVTCVLLFVLCLLCVYCCINFMDYRPGICAVHSLPVP